jgi:hypothetical protein
MKMWVGEQFTTYLPVVELYLHARPQFVCINNERCDTVISTCGVPQGKKYHHYTNGISSLIM